MGWLRIEFGLLLAGALACGRIEQRTVDEQQTSTGGSSAGRGGGATDVAGVGGIVGMGAAAGTVGVGGEIEPACGQAPNALPLQSLSNWEYARSAAAIIGEAAPEPFPTAVTYEPPFGYGLELTNDKIEVLFNEAEKYGAAASITLRGPCPDAEVTDACARRIIEPLVQRAFRRQQPADTKRYLTLFQTGATDGGWAGGLELLAEGVLMSPSFLFKWYPGEEGSGATARLSSFELASRLSYFLTGAPPDFALLDAAADGSLESNSGVEQQARRLLTLPIFPDHAVHFYSQWLGLNQLDNLVGPEYSLENLKAMRATTETFINRVFLADRSWPTLLLGNLEGFAHPDTIGGVLTSRSAMVRFDNPTTRGQFVRDRMLCMPVPPPPPGIPTLPPEREPGQTRREAWFQHRSNPACAACHQMMDPIGFGFENFDEAGLYRVSDNGQSIDASGEFINAGDIEGPFVGPDELKQRLAGSQTVAECHAKVWLSFALQRDPAASDDCFARQAYTAFTNSGFDIGELLVGIVLSPQFLSRDRYMGGRDTLPPPPGKPTSAIGQSQRRKVVLDFALAEAVHFAQVVSLEDRFKVEQYATGLRDLQIKLSQL